jgi:hypothetical protein
MYIAERVAAGKVAATPPQNGPAFARLRHGKTTGDRAHFLGRDNTLYSVTQQLRSAEKGKNIHVHREE